MISLLKGIERFERGVVPLRVDGSDSVTISEAIIVRSWFFENNPLFISHVFCVCPTIPRAGQRDVLQNDEICDGMHNTVVVVDTAVISFSVCILAWDINMYPLLTRLVLDIQWTQKQNEPNVFPEWPLIRTGSNGTWDAKASKM